MIDWPQALVLAVLQGLTEFFTHIQFRSPGYTFVTTGMAGPGPRI